MENRGLPENPVGSWDEYFRSSLEQPAHFLFEKAKRWVPIGGQALDIGCGVGAGARWLSGLGFEVVAMDGSEQAIKLLRERISIEDEHRIKPVLSLIEEFHYEPEIYDVVAGTFSLFFVHQDEIEEVWSKIACSIKPGGIFLGQFLGPNDSWANSSYSMQTEADVLRYLADFDVKFLDHVERDGKTVQGPAKHWDVFHVVAQKLGRGGS